ncbi:PP2C family protein-serine/threonine phosphatase [Streptomyces sp. 142MFCol3.1]|uniref:PP2C family protein-serine/threonine phosphatase n=1 Tax=Streptomyces sp. 142MFCol3.1 TaxID=1172179 RepID=UPI00040B5D41|nr:GAF domain-containing SpoIIE family protein phosphatase [Streptomyces sp. 142MFCol3.1]
MKDVGPVRTAVREDESSPGAFQASASIVQAGFFCWEIATGEVSCDPLTLALHGMPEDGPSDISNFLAAVHESDLADVRDALGLIAESCGNYQIEYRVTSDDDRHRSLEARGRVLPGADGLPARMVGVVMDTTAVHERHEAEKRRLYERATRDRWMRELTAALAAAVTVKDIMAAAHAGLRTFGADALAVIAPEGDRLTVVASCADDEQGEDSLRVLGSTARTLVEESLDRGAPVLIGSADALITGYPHLAPHAQSAPQAWAVLPLTDSRGRVSSCLVGFPEPQEFLPEERALLVAATGLLAQSLERAGMYESEHALATELQRGMLPRGPLTVPGVTIAARYQAATSGMWIGGDWYDAISLPDGGVALVIGDVQGHSVHAASLMGRLRTAVHAYANEGHTPAAVLERTNRLLAELNTDPDRALFATCCYIALNPSDGTLRVCRAGHPAPALITPRKPPRLLEVPGGLPLGIDREQRYPTTRLRIAPGSVLALTTDGLLEAVNKDIDQGIERFLRGLRGAPTADLETVVDDLLAGTQKAHGLGDDVALLLARLNRPGRHS